ncbi:hypothetical protein KDK_83150 [Dictyobacter kobayashii]|uniref:Protein kinase domain-containing protein n=1 Tax=Dictyobacter kobayashii TaxID=2014872 RepID=A0A402AZM2_9CHLR|nr:hypothetical protein KDK_83150 [Dictyobacter kobayashii]
MRLSRAKLFREILSMRLCLSPDIGISSRERLITQSRNDYSLCFHQSNIAVKNLFDCRTDQFAVSVILYQMLTGEFPYSQYPNVNPRVPVIPPERINKNVGTELSHIVMKGLSLDKNQRYDTSQAWLQAYLSIEEKFKAQNHQSPLTPVLTPWQKFMSIF